MKITTENFKEWLVYRKENKLPHPPLLFIRSSRVWILVRYKEDCDSIVFPDQTIMQWSPTELTWYHVNELATCAKPYDMHGWHVQCSVIIPEAPAYSDLIKHNESQKAY